MPRKGKKKDSIEGLYNMGIIDRMKLTDEEIKEIIDEVKSVYPDGCMDAGDLAIKLGVIKLITTKGK